MQVLTVNNLNKINNYSKIPFTSLSTNEVKIDEVTLSLRNKNIAYAMSQITSFDRQKYTQEINPHVLKILEEVPYEEFLTLCLQRKYGEKRDLNALEASTREGARYIVNRLEKDDLKKFLSYGIENLHKISLVDTRNDIQIAYEKYVNPRQDNMFGECWFENESRNQVWKNNALDLVFNKLGSNEIFEFYSSVASIDKKGNPLTYMDGLLSSEPYNVFLVLDRLNKKQSDYLLSETHATLAKCKPEFLCDIAKDYMDDEQDRFILFDDGLVLDKPESIDLALDLFSCDALEYLLDSVNSQELMFEYLESKLNNEDDKSLEKRFKMLVEKLPPEKFNKFYSQTKKFPYGGANYTLLTSAVKNGYANILIDAFPKSLLVELVKKDEIVTRGTLISPQELKQLAQKIGKGEYNKTRFAKFADYDLLCENY